MNLEAHMQRLSLNRGILEHLLAVPEQQARWRPQPDRWSLLEVINHLYDEEREDFRARLDVALHHHDRTYPPIDPMGWIVERSYNERDMRESLGGFLTERDKSLRWLAGIAEPDWDATASGSNLRAGDLLVSWVAHDFFHIHQIGRLHWDYLAAHSDPYAATYAGSLE
jgi:hypothetical protein